METKTAENVIQVTVNEFAEMQKVDWSSAYGLLKFLTARNKAQLIGTQKTVKGRGKNAFVYEVPISVNLDLVYLS